MMVKPILAEIGGQQVDKKLKELGVASAMDETTICVVYR
jgi:hypothetical protein